MLFRWPTTCIIFFSITQSLCCVHNIYAACAHISRMRLLAPRIHSNIYSVLLFTPTFFVAYICEMNLYGHTHTGCNDGKQYEINGEAPHGHPADMGRNPPLVLIVVLLLSRPPVWYLPVTLDQQLRYQGVVGTKLRTAHGWYKKNNFFSVLFAIQ